MSNRSFVSVVVPVYNDPEGLEDTLSSLVEQRSSPEFEVRVVDNNSTDETSEVIERFAAEYPDHIFSHEETDIQSSYAARNTGIKHAEGDIIVFLDADVVVEEAWVRKISRRFRNSRVDYLGCNVQMYNPSQRDTFWARYDLAMGLPVEHYLRTKNFAPTCALAVRREVTERVGTFEDQLVSGGDKEFGNRVSNSDFQMEFAEDIIVWHPARTSLRSNIKKSKRIAEGQIQLWAVYSLASHPISFTRFLPPSPRRVQNRKDSQFGFTPIYTAELVLNYVQSVTILYLYVRRLVE